MTGTANRDPVPYILVMCFLCRSLNQRFNGPDPTMRETYQRENPDDVLSPARIRDRNGLLSILPRRVEEWAKPSCTRCFNCFKSTTVDRQICDRRGRNQLEVGLPGPSRYLPIGASLSLIEVDASSCFLMATASDRKDYYHQLCVLQSRSNSNEMWPPLPAGDYLGAGGKRAKKHLPKPDLVHATFAAVPQDDHLGVEFATQSHRSLLQHHGLLDADTELTSALPWRGGSSLQGLVIDALLLVIWHF